MSDINQLGQIIKGILKGILSPALQAKLLFIKVIFIIISILFLFGIYYFIKKSGWLEIAYLYKISNVELFNITHRRKTKKHWKKIKEKIKSYIGNERKKGLIEADKMLAKIFALIGYKGKNLDEQLNHLKESQVSNLEELIQAHKICKSVKNPDYELPKETAKEIIDVFEKTFENLGINLKTR